MKAASLLVLLAVVFVMPAASQTSDDRLIVPGVRIGKWTLEMTMGNLVQMNGVAATVETVGARDVVPPPPQRHVWSGGFAAITRDGQKVEFLYIENSEYKTEKGVGPRSSRFDVEYWYGKPPAETEIVIGRTRWIYDEIGLAVVIEMDQVNVINVFRPRTGKSIFTF